MEKNEESIKSDSRLLYDLINAVAANLYETKTAGINLNNAIDRIDYSEEAVEAEQKTKEDERKEPQTLVEKLRALKDYSVRVAQETTKAASRLESLV